MFCGEGNSVFGEEGLALKFVVRNEDTTRDIRLCGVISDRGDSRQVPHVDSAAYLLCLSVAYTTHSILSAGRLATTPSRRPNVLPVRGKLPVPDTEPLGRDDWIPLMSVPSKPSQIQPQRYYVVREESLPNAPPNRFRVSCETGVLSSTLVVAGVFTQSRARDQRVPSRSAQPTHDEEDLIHEVRPSLAL